jgi:hypothetical protein
MPDHVHFFCRPELDAKPLSEFVGSWKSYTSRKINAFAPPRSTPAATTLWQREFFDHVLKSDESYSEKWNYVRDNPIRVHLVSSADDWPHAGEIETLIPQPRALPAAAVRISHWQRQNPQLQRPQNHALDVGINIEGRRTQESDERLIAFASEIDCETRRR